MADEPEWPTLTKRLEPLPGGLADLRRRIAHEATPRRAPAFGKMTFAAVALACMLALIFLRGGHHAPSFVASDSPRLADARVPASDKVVFYWVSVTPVVESHAVDPETLVAAR